MSGFAAGAAENFRDATFDFFRRGEERHWVEVALHRDVVANRGPAVVEIDAPIETDHAATGGANLFQ